MKTKAIILCLILLCVCVVSFAEDVPKDTNREQPIEVIRFSDDSRLTQKITYSAKNLPLNKIVDELTELTKITFRSGSNSSDWQVRDRKVSIFAKDTSVKSIISSMERVLKMRWRKTGESPDFVYRMILDRKSMLEAEKAWLADEQKMQVKRQEALTDYLDAANMSPEELEKIKNDNPMMYLAAKSGFAKPMADFFNANPYAADAVVGGQELTVTSENLSQQSQNALGAAASAFKKMSSRFGHGRGNNDDEVDGPYTVHINKLSSNFNSSMMPSMFLGEMVATNASGKNAMMVPLFDPSSKVAKMFGKGIIQSMEQNTPVEDIFKGKEIEFMMAQLSDSSQTTSKGEALIKHPDDPELDKKISAKFTGELFADNQKTFAEASSYCVVSDSFGGTSAKLSIAEVKDKPIKELLNSLIESNRYNWDKQDDIIEFRSRDWYVKVSAMIPDAWIEKWESLLKTTGTLSIDELVQISNLTIEQFTVNFSDKKELRDALMSSVGMRNRTILRFYGSLNDTQKNQVFTSSGLDLRGLSPQQISAFDQVNIERGFGGGNNPEPPVLLKGVYNQPQEKTEKPYYTFSLVATDESETGHWTIRLPQYVEKPKADNETLAKKTEVK